MSEQDQQPLKPRTPNLAKQVVRANDCPKAEEEEKGREWNKVRWRMASSIIFSVSPYFMAFFSDKLQAHYIQVPSWFQSLSCLGLSMICSTEKVRGTDALLGTCWEEKGPTYLPEHI